MRKLIATMLAAAMLPGMAQAQDDGGRERGGRREAGSGGGGERSRPARQEGYRGGYRGGMQGGFGDGGRRGEAVRPDAAPQREPVVNAPAQPPRVDRTPDDRGRFAGDRGRGDATWRQQGDRGGDDGRFDGDRRGGGVQRDVARRGDGRVDGRADGGFDGRVRERRGEVGPGSGAGLSRRDERSGRQPYRGNDGFGRSRFAGNGLVDRGGVRSWNREWRGDQRFDWNRYRTGNRNAYRLPRYYPPSGFGGGYGYRRFGIGFTLSSVLFDQSYWLDDPYAFRLPEAYGPYRWVRYYDDALLVDLRSGQVVDAVYGIFW